MRTIASMAVAVPQNDPSGPRTTSETPTTSVLVTSPGVAPAVATEPRTRTIATEITNAATRRLPMCSPQEKRVT